ncbi:OmpA family protein [Paraliomyxa miuraensis]|uniref:OmpA family protein n=1 Tax=Paraliomyxa miuraensis TaxID=376150 RepID=UPI002259D056|nr:OmpA family protein [Paraliomyxa miuraensis]MCX4244081.1 OmpA family protein [Paraliomyxa miuraensis]
MKRTAILLLCCVSVIACKKAEEPTTAPSTGDATDASGSGNEQAAEQADVGVDDEIAKLCDLPTARFAFDSSKLSKDAKNVLDQLASCFTTGPAKDQSMRLVGHADPRGDDDYNMGLGQRRAGSVSTYLAKRGLPDGRMETSSRGELDAVGTSESSWAKDRRVDIELAR